MEKFKNNIASLEFQNTLYSINSVDMHTCGEPLRVIYEGFPTLRGKTILEKRHACKLNYDFIRQSLMFEPRGHADMYGAIVVEAEREESDFGVLFTHNEGYSTMCGHAIIALTQLAIQTGYKSIDEVLKIDTPAGLVTSKSAGDSASFINVPSFVYAKEKTIQLENKQYQFDIAFGGAFYAFIDADKHDISLSTSEHQSLKILGLALKNEIQEKFPCAHPNFDDLSFLYGVIFYSSSQVTSTQSHSKHVCIFAEGELDRSPTGTGVSARVAILYDNKQLNLGQPIQIESILGESFTVEIDSFTEYANYRAILPKVTGSAYITGQHTFLCDPRDPLANGFIFK